MDKITFNYEDKILDVDIIYRKRKNISIKITPKDRIQIIAPHKVPIKILKETIEKNSSWILSKLDKFKNMDDSFLKRDYVDGEIYYYIGKPHYLKIIKDKNMQNKKNYNYISIKEEYIEIRTNNWEGEYLKESLKKWYKLKSEEIVMDRLAYLREQSDYFRKIEPNLIKVKEQKKIWGSCNSNKNIYINSKISMLPVEAIDYIIAHEFCHILYMNHSKDFYASVEKIIPNYKEINLWLKKNSYKFTL
ncbi:MAG: SprT family zinc-dependent metalloprotease [Intestinibacter sp.]|uniref:M48 family metallopeptidase n=1 Tax=Intestinibacter sp. TaxID=1965304 RepID=UPI002A823793|nr:SprT family zinc-dependent metalloprotease [Intestinibacter sp.]MDY4574010.1 SprT family zinc-dependent metalloprotease [Intestinibacter sp.]